MTQQTAQAGAREEGAGERLRLSLDACGPLEALEVEWGRLEQASSPSFFLSWAWIGTLLDLLPEAERPSILKLYAGERLIGLALAGEERHRRLGLLPQRRLHLNEAGRPEIDCITIEYNGLLTAEPERQAAGIALLLAAEPGIDALVASGLQREAAGALAASAARLGWQERRLRCDIAWAKRLPADAEALMESFGRNTRPALRRSQRLYEASLGPLALDVARDQATALRYLEGLKALHQAAWKGRGKAGAFAQPFFERFHRRLIERSFGQGCIQLARVTAGAQDLGYLYGFLWRGRLLSYQSGFRLEGDNRLKPGLLCHYLAMRHNAGLGVGLYDFLAGDSRYKRSLADESEALLWIELLRDGPGTRLELALRRLKQSLSRRALA